MFENYRFTAAERFMRYVRVDTQSDPKSMTSPSTENQKRLSEILVEELLQIGVTDAEMDEFGYVFGTIPANTASAAPVICFCSHVDTAPDCSGLNVKPILHTNYAGQDIILPDDPSQVIQKEDYPYLQEHVGKNIITASGKTLLGADDKSGIAIIMDLANFLLGNNQVKHGKIRILFTPDEEVGRGTTNLDLDKLGADYAYTLDGGEAGSLEDETFNADGVKITIKGVIAHPGYAKNKLVNALKIAGEILDSLPKDRLSPETTNEREGFLHPVAMQGIAEEASLEFIVRSFDQEGLENNEAALKRIASDVLKKYSGATMNFAVHEQYRNMKPILDKYPQVIANAEEAIRLAGLKVKKESIRGGTDGSRLSHLGLPCPNIFTGMQAIHSKHEWIGVDDMEKSVQTLAHLCMLWTKKR
ncbi:MAG: peptidase T [Chitinophagaceae bacterium]